MNICLTSFIFKKRRVPSRERFSITLVTMMVKFILNSDPPRAILINLDQTNQ